jgi:hypothetical protein
MRGKSTGMIWVEYGERHIAWPGELFRAGGKGGDRYLQVPMTLEDDCTLEDARWEAVLALYESCDDVCLSWSSILTEGVLGVELCMSR